MKKAYGITMNNESYEIIPPTPSEDRGGITQTEYDKFNNYETEIEQNKTDILNN